jgi:hypothetical protein
MQRESFDEYELFKKWSGKPRTLGDAALPPDLTWDALRRTYVSICIAAGLSALQVSRFMSHAKPTTTLAIYAHLFDIEGDGGRWRDGTEASARGKCCAA